MKKISIFLPTLASLFFVWSCVATNPVAPSTKTNASSIDGVMPPSGTTYVFAGSGVTGYLDGNTSNAQFQDLACMAFDASGNLWLADFGTNKLRMISSTFQVTTIAGSGTSQSIDGTGTSASFMGPVGLTIDSSGNLYVGENTGHRIRKVTTSGAVTTLCGSGIATNFNGTGTNAAFNYPVSLCMDSAGNIFVGDAWNFQIRKITPSGVVTTFAGSGLASSIDGTGTSAAFNFPVSITIDTSGNLYVCDYSGNKIRKVSSAGIVTTLCGNGTAGTNDGSGASAQFTSPGSICIDQQTGTLYVSDWGSQKLRKVSSAGVVTTIPLSTGVTSQGMAFYKGYVYIGDHYNKKILKVSP